MPPIDRFDPRLTTPAHPHPGIVTWLNTCMFGVVFVILPVTVTVLSLIVPIRLPRSPFGARQGIGRKPGTGRNQPCPCGSGKKYKRCCG